jgi:hypothetical protein
MKLGGFSQRKNEWLGQLCKVRMNDPFEWKIFHVISKGISFAAIEPVGDVYRESDVENHAKQTAYGTNT